MRISSILEKLIAPLGCLSVACFGALHVWTVYLAYQAYGLLAAMGAAGLVIFAEIYFAILAWKISGFDNWYTLAVIAVFAIFGAASFLYWLKTELGLFDPEKQIEQSTIIKKDSP